MIKKRILAFVIAFAALFAIPVCAAEKDAKLIIEYTDGSKALSGARFDLYYVAETEDYSYFTLTEDFEDYPIKVNGLDSEGYRRLASTLESYIDRDDIEPYDSGKTDKNGRLEFPEDAARLKKGLYLILGNKCNVGNYKYTAEPVLVFVPGIVNETGELIYTVTVEPKYDKDKINDGKDYVTRKVIKVWDDDGNKSERPKSITVQLLRNKKVYDTVVLNSGNNWKYTWTKLDADYDWKVAEKKVDGYTVDIYREGITFVITNTADKPDKPVIPVKPDKPDKPVTPDKPSTPNIPNEPSTPVDSDRPVIGSMDNPPKPAESLPQTGMLWWPVPILAASGILLVAVGRRVRRGAEHEE